MTLAEVPLGQCFVIQALTADGSDLLHLGFVPGSQVRLVRRAPFGDPIEVEIAGARLAIRREALGSVTVVAAGEQA